MIKRYLSPIIGDGSEGNPYRAKIANFTVDYTSTIKSNPDGSPTFSWALVKVNADVATHNILKADAEIDVLPEALLITLILDLPSAAKDALSANLIAKGIDTTFSAEAKVKDAVNRIGRYIEPTFNEDTFWVD